MADPRRCAHPKVIVTRALPDVVMRRLDELFDVVANVDDVPMTRDALAAAMAECDVLVPAVTDTIDAALIESAGARLRLIANFGAGVNHIDLKAARAPDHRHQHAGRADRGYRRHDDGADRLGPAPDRRG